jgi:uncharacterized protein YndB with AHSA1/START domain
MPDINHTLEIAAEPARVFDAINSAEGNRAFWTDQTEYRPVEGEVAVFSFGPNQEVQFRFRIDRIDAPRLLEWSCVDGPPEWRPTRIRWQLEPHGDGGTRLRFEHLGWASADGELGTCSFTWARVLQRLQAWVTDGAREPVFSRG